MNEPNSPTDSAKEIQALRMLFVGLLAVLIVMGGSVLLYLRGQRNNANEQLKQAKNNIEEYEKKFTPYVNGLIGALQDYSKKNPDINPLLARYNMLPAPTSSVPQKPAANVMPKTPTTPKK